MFAIVKTGGKQYRVASGDQVVVERIVGEVGSRISLPVLAIGGGESPLLIGKPVIEGAAVHARIAQQPRGTKVIVFKKKRRKNYRRKRGHRQELTVLVIESITLGAEESAPAPSGGVESPAPEASA